MTPNNDSPETDAPDAADDDSFDAPYAVDGDAYYPKWIHLSLRNCNCNYKIAPNTKKQYREH